jgi:hypothetical protein
MPTKVPYQRDGSLAKTDDSGIWASYTEVCVAFRPDRDPYRHRPGRLPRPQRNHEAVGVAYSGAVRSRLLRDFTSRIGSEIPRPKKRTAPTTRHHERRKGGFLGNTEPRAAEAQ